MRSRSLGLLSAGLLSLAELSEGSLPRQAPALPRLSFPVFQTEIRFCPACQTLHSPEESRQTYELVTGLADPSSAQHIFDEMQEHVTDLETLAVAGVTLRHRESDDSLKLYPEDSVYPGQTPNASYADTSFILVYVDLTKHPSTFTLQIARDGTNIYSHDFDLAPSPARRGFLLFTPQELAPTDYRLHGPANYTIETLVPDDEDPDSSRHEQRIEFFIEHK
jgi:hypothetical protein